MNGLDPFVFHGFHATNVADGQAQGNCLFCKKDGHFWVNTETLLWDCKRCGKTGNLQTFIRDLHEQYLEETEQNDYERASKSRGGLILPGSFEKAGLAWNADEQRWLVPIMNAKGKLHTLRKWRGDGPLINTKGIGHGIWGAEQLSIRSLKDRPIWICEGEGDGILLRELFRRFKVKAIVMAVPGANVLKKDWLAYFTGRHVTFAYDADTPGDNGMVNGGKKLEKIAKSIGYVRWPLDLENGYDIGDLVKEYGAKKALDRLLALVTTAPRTISLKQDGYEPLKDVKTGKIADKPKKKRKGPMPFKRLMAEYEKWLDMSADTKMALRITTATILSNQVKGDPLWFYLVAPPGGGKTVLLNPLRSIPDHCIFRSNLTMHSLVSGWQGDKDPSLIPLLDGKTLVLKDMTEILSAPSHVQDEIFGTLRGAYDGFLDRSYGNAVFREYESNFSMIAGVTVQIHGHGQASMGERALKFQLSRSRKEQETIIQRAMDNIGLEEELESGLSDVTEDFLNREIDVDELRSRIPKWARDRIIALSQLVAALRMEVERDFRGDQVKYRPQVEVGTRLAKQLLKTGMVLTETCMGKPTFGVTEWNVIERIAFNTAIGWNLDVVQSMMENGGLPLNKNQLAKASNLPPSNVTRRLEDLSIAGMLNTSFDKKTCSTYYQLVEHVQSLWKRSMVQNNHSALVVELRKHVKGKLRPRRKLKLKKED